MTVYLRRKCVTCLSANVALPVDQREQYEWPKCKFLKGLLTTHERNCIARPPVMSIVYKQGLI